MKRSGLLVVSTGCPCGIGPEVSVAAAARLTSVPKVLIGDEATLRGAAQLVGVAAKKLMPWDGRAEDPRIIYYAQVGDRLSTEDRQFGQPTRRSGVAQLEYIEAAYTLVKSSPRAALVTGPVSKSAIARSGLSRARGFLGHTEWLQALDGAPHSVMCFFSERLTTSLVTTHLPLARVPRAISAEAVARATVELGKLLLKLGKKRLKIAIASLNPHAGEGELLGAEEARAIAPGAARARRALGKNVEVIAPLGAETAYRKAAAGAFDGVVAMYHDQATIPMKLLAFGDAVNVTAGLSIVRTSVDHGTAYDIAGRGLAEADGMLAALELARRFSER